MPDHPEVQAGALHGQIAVLGLTPPKRLTVAITSACNLRCEHCLVASSPIPGNLPPVGLQPLKKLIQEFVDLGGEELWLTGGEPMTHPDWLDVLAACCTHPGLQRVLLQTNGTLIDDGIARVLANNGFARLSLQVSLEGCSPSTHDLVRGSGSLEMALRGLRCLADAGLAARTSIAFTEMRHNFEDIPQLLVIAEQIGVSAVVGQSVIVGESARQSKTALLPAREQYLALLDRFERDADFRKRCQRLGSFPALAWMAGAAHSAHGGCRFLEHPYATADGLLFPCALLQVRAFAGHGIYQRSLAEVISDSLPLWTELQAVSRARTIEMPCIDSCAGGYHCGGGCLARAYLPGGDLGSREDRCELRRAVYARHVESRNRRE